MKRVLWTAVLGTVVAVGLAISRAPVDAHHASAPFYDDMWTYDGQSWNQVQLWPTPRARVAAGMVYDRAVHIYAMGQMGPYNNDMGASIVTWLQEQHPDFRPRRILDMGCTVGHSTCAIASYFPDAETHAIDVSRVVEAHHDGIILAKKFATIAAVYIRRLGPQKVLARFDDLVICLGGVDSVAGILKDNSE